MQLFVVVSILYHKPVAIYTGVCTVLWPVLNKVHYSFSGNGVDHLYFLLSEPNDPKASIFLTEK